jgi:hypothetical protein
VPSDIPSRFPREDYERVAELDIPPTGHRIRRQSSGLDAGTKRLAIIASAIGGVLVLIVGAWSIAGHRTHAIPVLQAQSGPLRVKPDNPGGMQVTGADETILSGSSGKESEALAPPPEAPEPKALQAQREAEQARPAPSSPAVSTPGISPPPPATSAPNVMVTSVPASPMHAVAMGRESGTLRPPQAKALPPVATHPAPPAKIATMSRTVAPEHPAIAAGRGSEVQLAALRSEEAAKTEWERLARRMPDLFNGRHPLVIRTEHDGRTYWRLRTGGFGDLSQATQFCEHVRAKGGGCSVASF